MTAQNWGLTGEQISALKMLAGCPDGCTEAVLKANGFKPRTLSAIDRNHCPNSPESATRPRSVTQSDDRVCLRRDAQRGRKMRMPGRQFL
jgi:hypothetical protein